MLIFAYASDYFIEGIFVIYFYQSLCITFIFSLIFLLFTFLKCVNFHLPIEIAVAKFTLVYFSFSCLFPCLQIHVHGRQFKQYRTKGRGSKHFLSVIAVPSAGAFWWTWDICSMGDGRWLRFHPDAPPISCVTLKKLLISLSVLFFNHLNEGHNSVYLIKWLWGYNEII